MIRHCYALLIVVFFMAAGCTNNNAGPIVGNDQDDHGCKASAGYQWSVLKNECIRIFETGIRLNPQAPGLDQTTSAFAVFKAEDDDQQVELFLPGQSGSMLLNRVADDGAGTWKSDTFILTQWRGMYTLEGKSGTTLYQGPAVAEMASGPSTMLQGKWQSLDDAKSFFEIQGTSLIHSYDGQKMDARIFEFSADCSGNACAGGASDYGCYTSAGEMDIECYSIISITDSELQVSVAGGRGNTLRYKKVN